jgi:hypothetical protein
MNAGRLRDPSVEPISQRDCVDEPIAADRY